jgi:hypothetical protein
MSTWFCNSERRRCGEHQPEEEPVDDEEGEHRPCRQRVGELFPELHRHRNDETGQDE